MRTFTLADGDTLCAPPAYISRTFPWGPNYEGKTIFRFNIELVNGTRLSYSSTLLIEVERERRRLLNFDWKEKDERHEDSGGNSAR